VASAAKGKQFFEILVSTCVEFVREFSTRTVRVTVDFPVRHARTDIF
jgi:hypothetical protein